MDKKKINLIQSLDFGKNILNNTLIHLSHSDVTSLDNDGDEKNDSFCK